MGRMFEEIMQILADEDTFVVVLIGWSHENFGDIISNMSCNLRADEVESLTSARKGAVSGNEPSDSLRV